MDITNYVLSRRERALLIGDHGTYRTQLSRQLKTLRKQLGRATPKNARFSYKPITAEDIGGNPEFAHIILLTAERAWAHAIHMKSSHADDSSAQKIPGSRRSHVVSRLVKAAKQARTLVDALEQNTAGGTKEDWLEAKAYASYLEGSAEFEKHSGSPKSSDKSIQREKWQDCLEELAISRIIYSAFFKKTKKDYFKDFITTSIDPSIRYAAYQSQIPRTVPVPEVARKCFPSDEEKLAKAVESVDVGALKEESAQDGGASGLPTSITWRSRKANIVDASIGQALVDVARAEEELKTKTSTKSEQLSTSAQAAAYDGVLIASQDAVDATRHAIEEHEKEKIPESDSRMQDLRVTSLSVNYDMIGWRVGRNRVLIGARDGIGLASLPMKAARSQTNSKEVRQKPEGRGRKLARLRERVVLFDAILQSIESIKELRGAARDETFIAELDGKRAYFQALKCLNIAYSHELLDDYRSTLALVVRAESLASSALKAVSASKQPELDSPLKLDLNETSAQELQSHLTNLVYQYNGLVDLQAANEANRGTGEKDKISQVPVIHRLNEYPAGGADLTNLVTYPPKLEPVPVKPLFLDLAWNYIDYPGIEAIPPKSTSTPQKSEKQNEASPAEEKPKKGWFGFGR